MSNVYIRDNIENAPVRITVLLLVFLMIISCFISWAFGRKSLIPEAKLVQTFPLDYYLAGNLREQYIQIGNAVPPLMSYRRCHTALWFIQFYN